MQTLRNYLTLFLICALCGAYPSASFAGQVEHFTCEAAKMSFNFMGQKFELSKSEIKQFVRESKLPKDCLLSQYTMGNSVIARQPYPAACGDPTLSPQSFFPVEFQRSGSKLAFSKTMKILNPEFGAATLRVRGSFDQEQMTMVVHGSASIEGQKLELMLLEHCY